MGTGKSALKLKLYRVDLLIKKLKLYLIIKFY